jgi:UrcA family protein
MALSTLVKETTMNTSTSTFLRTLVAGAILSALASGVALASSFATVTAPPQLVVKFADLDISTPQGATALYGRIRSAAVKVCWPSRDNASDQVNTACLQKAIADAVTTVNRPALSAVYEAKYGKEPAFVLATNQTR